MRAIAPLRGLQRLFLKMSSQTKGNSLSIFRYQSIKTFATRPLDHSSASLRVLFSDLRISRQAFAQELEDKTRGDKKKMFQNEDSRNPSKQKKSSQGAMIYKGADS
jgi:hypothetical protein